MIAGLLLAAGGSTRFGSQKLLARIGDGDPLVRQTALALRDAVDKLTIVVGSDADAVQRALAGIDATIVTNAEWSQGVGTSLRAGVRGLPAATMAVVVALGDQPFVDPAIVRAVVTEWRTTGSPIVSARYAGTRSHPVLFDRSMFAELESVSGDRGARAVIDRDPARVVDIDVSTPMPLDVDTPADLAAIAERRQLESTRRDR
jgi:molybdenum cofactor cytidylyltransferase